MYVGSVSSVSRVLSPIGFPDELPRPQSIIEWGR